MKLYNSLSKKRLWEQWAQHTVMAMDAFWPTFLPIENLRGRRMADVFQKIQPHPGLDIGQESWPKGTHDSLSKKKTLPMQKYF